MTKKEPRLAETGVPVGRLSVLAGGIASLSVPIVVCRVLLKLKDSIAHKRRHFRST